MNPANKFLYALGFIVAVFGIGYGLGQTGDQLRLGLFLGGISIGTITIIAWIISTVDEDRIKKMGLADLEDLRPDLQITSKLTGSQSQTMAKTALLTEKQEDHMIPRRVTEFPLECGFCTLIITPSMKEIAVGEKHFHEDCWEKQKQRDKAIANRPEWKDIV